MHSPNIERLKNLQKDMLSCRRCLDAGYDIMAGAIFSGGSGADLMVIGQAPGVTEVAAKRPFNAGSGRRLFQWLESAGWEEHDFRKRHYMTAVTKCYPGKNKSGRGDRVPSKEEQAFCRPFLSQEMTLIRPKLIIPVGGLAINLFFPNNLRLNEVIGTAIYLPTINKKEPLDIYSKYISILEGFQVGFPSDGIWVVPLPHPSGASIWPNRPENRVLIDRAISILADIRTELEL